MLSDLFAWLSRSFAWLSGKASGHGRGSRALASLWPGSQHGWPGTWSSDRFEQVRHYRHWVYVGIRAIADEIARQVPQVSFVHEVDEERTEGARRWKGYNAWHRTKSIIPHGHGEELEPAPPYHPLVRLLKDPNGPDTGWDFFYEMVLFLKLTGNAYLWVVPNLLGLPAELWVVPSHWVRGIPGKERLIDHYEVRPYGVGSAALLKVPEADMIHLKDKHPLTKLDGFAPLQAGAEWIDTEESISRTWWAHFKEGCWPGLHLKLPQGVDPDDEEMDRLYAKFLSRFQGEMNAGRPIITSNGAELGKVTFTPTEMNYTGGAELTRDMILALLGVPKGVVGLEPASAQLSVYGPFHQFTRFTVSPLLGRIGQAFTEKLGSRYPGSPRVWYPDPTPNDPKQANEDLRTDILARAVTPNEVRALRGRPPIEQSWADLPVGGANDPGQAAPGKPSSGKSRIAGA